MPAPGRELALDDLASLIATEERLEVRLTEAKAEAARLVRAADEAARERAQRVEHELAGLARKIDDAAARDRAARLGEIDTRAAAERAAFDTVGEERVNALGRYVAALVTAGEGGSV